jgi:hypothetical protein
MPRSSTRGAICATAHNRPERLERLLASVARAQGCAQWTLFLSIEPTPRLAEIQAVVDRYRPALQLHSRVNADCKGVRQNPFDTVEWALANGSETILLLEDDLIIDRQALRWCELLAASALMETHVMCANLLMTTCMSESIFVPASSEVKSLSNLVMRTRFFSSIGLLLTKRQWAAHFRGNWFVDDPFMENWEGRRKMGWDISMNRLLLDSDQLEVLQSFVPRVTHDGADGTHATPDFQSRSFANVAVDSAADVTIEELRVCDPLTDLTTVPSASARMYLNLCRHLWTLQRQSLAFKRLAPDLAGARARSIHLGGHEYVMFRRPSRR